jgi:hypothetical protein
MTSASGGIHGVYVVQGSRHSQLWSPGMFPLDKRVCLLMTAKKSEEIEKIIVP